MFTYISGGSEYRKYKLELQKFLGDDIFWRKTFRKRNTGSGVNFTTIGVRMLLHFSGAANVIFVN